MNRFFTLAALVAGALAAPDEGYGGGYGSPSYGGSPTAKVTSFVAAPPMPSSMMANPAMSSMYMSMSSSMYSSMYSSMNWEQWSSSSAMFATPTAAAAASAAPSLVTITSVAMPTSSGWPSSPMASHTVMVGGSSVVYTPSSLSGVKDKDTIIFLFLQKNHTLTQSSFAMPCNKSDGGFKSGFLPSDGNYVPFVLAQYSDSMNTGTPMWFYCGQADHCQKGMRFSINAPNDKDTAWRAIDVGGGSSSAYGGGWGSSSAAAATYTASTTASTMASSTAWSSWPSASVTPGWGTATNGQCACDCLCGANSFPAGAGMGMMGGMPGMIPASAAPSMAPAAAAASSAAPAYGGSGYKLT